MTDDNKKERKPFSKKYKIVIIAVAAVLAVLLIAGGSYCIATDQSPISAVQSAFTSNKKEIIAKWQSQEKPELVAYVFYEDGSYDSYLSNFNFDGEYTIERNRIKLYNPDTKKELVYRFSIRGDVLTLTLLEEDGEEAKEQEVSKFDKVDELNMKSLTDIIGEIKKSGETTTEKK